MKPLHLGWFDDTTDCFRSLTGGHSSHRYAVIDPDGHPAVYIPRRDTGSRLVALAGGRIFPGSHHRARITGTEHGDQITVTLDSHDNAVHVVVSAGPTDHLPNDSVFADPAAASAFFEYADTGYSDTTHVGRLDALTLRATNWSASPLVVDHVESSYFEDPERFPSGTVTLDHALVMRDIHHTWHPRPRRDLRSPRTDEPTNRRTPADHRGRGRQE